ncbi:MAG: hypothetical protein V4490_05065 [Pseudomonadota bacterium]
MDKELTATLCEYFNLGKPLFPRNFHDIEMIYPIMPTSVYEYCDFRVQTDRGSFLIKQMLGMPLTEACKKYFRAQEQCAREFQSRGILTVSSIKAGDEVTYLDNKGIAYLAYPYVHLYSLPRGKVNRKLAIKIADQNISIYRDIVPSDGYYYMGEDQKNYLASPRNDDIGLHFSELRSVGKAFHEMTLKDCDPLFSLQDHYYQTIHLVNSNHLRYIHTEVAQENVLWTANGTPVIINWLNTDYANPARDFLYSALMWSGFHSELNLSVFMEMLSYFERTHHSWHLYSDQFVQACFYDILIDIMTKQVKRTYHHYVCDGPLDTRYLLTELENTKRLVSKYFQSIPFLTKVVDESFQRKFMYV